MDYNYVDLSEWTTIRISGPQKFEYLNGIVTYELKDLSKKGVARCAFLTPNARIRSIFWIKEKDDVYIIHSPPIFKNSLIEDLLKYKLSMKVKLEDITDELPPMYLQIGSGSKIEGLSIDGENVKFVNLMENPDKVISYSTFKDHLILHDIAPVDIMNNQVPYEVGLNDAITLEKGCFLGQEPISRMFHRGKPRKFYFIIESAFEIKKGEIVQNNDIIGEVIEIKESGNKFIGIASIKSSTSGFSDITQSSASIDVKGKIGNYPNISR